MCFFTAAKTTSDETDEKTFEAIVAGLKDLDDFDAEFGVMIGKLKPNQGAHELAAYKLISGNLQQILREKFFKMEVHPFGSIVTKLGFENSDIDLHLANVKPLTQPDDVPILHEIKRILVRSRMFVNCFVIPRANVPIVRCVHLNTGVQCDINVNNMLGVFNSQLIRYYMGISPKVLQAMLVLKYWAKCHKITGQNQHFSNYAVTMMFIFFLQQAPYSVPSVQAIQQATQTAFWDITCFPMSPFRSEALMKVPLLELVGHFFAFCAEYPFHKEVICPHLGKSLLKTSFYLQDNGLVTTGTVCVEDPLELNRNVASAVTVVILKRLVLFCRMGKDICSSKKSVLHKLLTEIPGEYKKQPVRYNNNNNADSFQTVIHKSLIGNPQWFKNLGQFLQIALEKFLLFTVTIEDNDTVGVFVCHSKFNIWGARKSTAKQLSLSAQKMSLVEREQAITNHMKASVPEQMKELPDVLSFKLTVTLNGDEALICANKLTAYKKSFKSFADFFLCNFATWFEMYQNDNASESATYLTELTFEGTEDKSK